MSSTADQQPPSAEALAAERERRNKRTLKLLAGLAIGMFAFGFAMVPLYGLLCQVTGIQSVEQRSAKAPDSINATAPATSVEVDEDRWVTVKFAATVHTDLPWSVVSQATKMRVRPGEMHELMFTAENRSAAQITAQAIPSIAPWQATAFFTKLECFCFKQQTLAGLERKEMPLRFLVSPDLPEGIDSLTLSYNVMRIPDAQKVADSGD